MGDFASVFDEAGTSAEQAAADRAMAQAKQASRELQTYFLNAAENEEDFSHRLALAENELTKAATSAGISVHALISEHTREFGLLMEARRAQAEMVRDKEHKVLKDAFDKAFSDLKAAGIPHDADHPIAKAYRDASDAVNHANRSRDYAIATGQTTASMPALPDQADDDDYDSDDRTSWERWGDQPLHEMDPGDAQDNWYRDDYRASLQHIRTALAEGVDPLEWIEEQPEAQGQGQPEKPSESGQSAWQEGYEGADNGIGRSAAAAPPVQDGLFDAPSKPTQTPLDIPDQYGYIKFHQPGNVHKHHSKDAGEVHILDSQRSANGKHQVMVIDSAGNSQWPMRYDDNSLGFDNPHSIVTPHDVIHRAIDHAEHLDRTRGTKTRFSEASKGATRPF